MYRPRRDLNRAIGLMLNSTAASYTQLDYARAINRRLSSCSRIGFHEAYARAPASGFSRERPRDRLVSYARYRASFSFLRGARLSDDAPFVFKGSGEFSRVGEEEIGG